MNIPIRVSSGIWLNRRLVSNSLELFDSIMQLLTERLEFTQKWPELSRFYFTNNMEYTLWVSTCMGGPVIGPTGRGLQGSLPMDMAKAGEQLEEEIGELWDSVVNTYRRGIKEAP